MSNSQSPTQLTSSTIDPDEYLYISSSGFKAMVERKVDLNASKDVLWTTDYTYELPIRMKKEGPGKYILSLHIYIYKRNNIFFENFK